jgi:hypothetical protein
MQEFRKLKKHEIYLRLSAIYHNLLLTVFLQWIIEYIRLDNWIINFFGKICQTHILVFDHVSHLFGPFYVGIYKVGIYI